MGSEIRSYRDLVVWQRGMALAEAVDSLCNRHGGPGLYAMTDQLMRAADSIPANIAEGYGRYSRRDYLRFVTIANGSLKELETRLLRARTRIPAAAAEVDRLLESCGEVGRLLTGLTRALKEPKGARAANLPNPSPAERNDEVG